MANSNPIPFIPLYLKTRTGDRSLASRCVPARPSQLFFNLFFYIFGHFLSFWPFFSIFGHFSSLSVLLLLLFFFCCCFSSVVVLLLLFFFIIVGQSGCGMGVGGVRYSVSEKFENFAHYAPPPSASRKRSLSLSFLEAKNYWF